MLQLKLALLAAVVLIGAACKPIQQPVDDSALRSDEPTADQCGGDAMKERRKQTFSRTVDCAADAASAGIADKIKTGATVIKEAKGVVTAVKGLVGKLRGVSDISTAKTALCVMSVVDYAGGESIKNQIKGMANAVGNFDELWAELQKDALSSASLGVTEVFAKFEEASTKPSAESVYSFVVATVDNLSKLGTFATTCGPLFTGLGADVGIVKLFNTSKALGNIGVYASIGKCIGAVIFNAVDVGTEVNCLLKDLAYITEQKKAIQRALAFESARINNHARWHSCQFCLQDTWASAKNDKDACQRCCASEARENNAAFEPQKTASWSNACGLICGTAYTEGIIRNYTDLKVCKEIDASYARNGTSKVYRYIDMLTPDDRTKAEADQIKLAGEFRAEILAHVEVLRRNYRLFDTATVAGEDGAVGLQDFEHLSNAANINLTDAGEKELVRRAADFFGKQYILTNADVQEEYQYMKRNVGKPYFFVLLETATNGGNLRTRDNTDGIVGPSDLTAFAEEVRQYATEVEHKTPGATGT